MKKGKKSINKRIIYTFIITLIIVFTTNFSVLMALERTDYRNYLQGQYSKEMYQLINSVQNIRSNLSKVSVVGSKEQTIMGFEDIFRYSTIARDKLNSLPVPHEDVAQTSKFLSQVGDFSYSYAKSISKGNKLTKEDYDKINNLEAQAYELEQRLDRVIADINEGRVKWGEIRKKAGSELAKKSNPKAIAKEFNSIQKQVVQYPALIYDGPFSDNNLNIKPRIETKNVINQKEAENKVKKIIGADRISSMNMVEKEKGSKIQSYRFNVKLKGQKDSNIVCEVSKNGGKLLYLLNNRSIKKASINNEKAIDIGKKYLERQGYKTMEPSFTMKYSNMLTINYVYKQDNVTIYPEQIKLKIALDNGEIVGIEAEKYLVAHIDNRKIPSPKITEKEARNKVSKNLDIKSSRLVIIPSESNKELLCYEFNGSYNGKKYIVYINALTGYEERIIQIIDTHNGQLTI